MNSVSRFFGFEFNLSESELLYSLQLCIVALYVISLVMVLSVTFEIND